ncbi:ABC transporter substrate-binding protein [Aestuariirhabdus litorea]|uniref:Branched-chain amino acid ABC transporter substrate-binding protein n=1 Tax=Aestuariirhabdus litorea TaxID=2528527 RepID=A0A3P3VMU3_9GAMM|nr:ABC transporter substrate-binding protein [Aestuariirhabdus litorea]RRJ84081.1 branched-chain amino acid ABC transporter substrate-binding protein [Aestuariirhabdus litorea]RWW97301.1 branched-chain amino acid ABC transporter substrate-binding protein [Endozoicomonadaceae bacterium GTF-13]
MKASRWLFLLAGFCTLGVQAAEEVVKVGLNYPKTGHYKEQGLEQMRGALMALDEINASGGILGKRVEMVSRNTSSVPEKSVRNVEDMVRNEGVKMLFGGSSSAVAIASGKKARALNVPYFGTLTYSNSTTGEEAHSHMFRETYNAWMSSKVLSKHLNEQYAGKKFFYITADYTWGWTTEESLRMFTNTTDTGAHPGVKTPFPKSRVKHFKEALAAARDSKADVLVLVLFGNDMVRGLTLAYDMGLKKQMAIVVPNLTLGMARDAGPTVMSGVLGAVPWSWKVPYIYDYPRGKQFVEEYARRYSSYPSSSAASAYSILYQYKDAVERAQSFDTKAVIRSLEGHSYSLLKDEQIWRKFDHQNVQTVYAVRCRDLDEVFADRYNLDYFEVIDSLPGIEAARTYEEWAAVRKKANRPLLLN